MNNKTITHYVLYIAISILIVSVFATIQIHYVLDGNASASVYIIPVIVGVMFGAILAKVQHLSEELKQAANTDSLTKLGNRRSFIAELNDEIQKSQRYKFTFSIILIDVDYFKQINDTHGHQTGDIALQALALLLSESSRTSDSCAR